MTDNQRGSKGAGKASTLLLVIFVIFLFGMLIETRGEGTPHLEIGDSYLTGDQITLKIFSAEPINYTAKIVSPLNTSVFEVAGMLENETEFSFETEEP